MNDVASPEEIEKLQEEAELKAKEKEKAKKEKKKGGKKGKKKGKGEEDPLEGKSIIEQTMTVMNIQTGIQEYQKEWGKNQEREEDDNFDQRHDDEKAKQLLRPEVYSELEDIVDKMIKAEIDDMRK